MFLKVYACERVFQALTGVDEKTFRKWAWLYVHAIGSLEVVLFLRHLISGYLRSRFNLD
jgi:hypothetical protein